MTSLVRCLALCALFASFGWTVSAQDKKEGPAKKDDDPAVKKDDAKKDDPKKKDDGKGKKKDPVKKQPPPEEFPKFSETWIGKIQRVPGENQTDFSMEIQVIDPEKVARFQTWQRQQLVTVNTSKTAKEYNDRMLAYQRELAGKKESDLYSPKNFEVRAADKIKVRSLAPPQEYDDKGFLKQWTQKELAALRGNTKLPGYPATMENLKVGYVVQIYVVPAPKVKADPKKNPDDPDAPPKPAPKPLPEVVVLVIGIQK